MFRFHCPHCASHHIGVLSFHSANPVSVVTEEEHDNISRKLMTNMKLLLKDVVPQYGGQNVFACADCGFVTTAPLMPQIDKSDANRLLALNPGLGLVN